MEELRVGSKSLGGNGARECSERRARLRKMLSIVFPAALLHPICLSSSMKDGLDGPHGESFLFSPGPQWL